MLFIQGGGADTHDEWDDKLVDSLRRELGDGYDIRYPRMPAEDDPSFAAWGPAISDAIAALQEGAIVVGHSVGGTLLIHTLSERPPDAILAAIVLLAAPFVGVGGWPAEEFELSSNLGSLLPADVPVHLFHGLAGRRGSTGACRSLRPRDPARRRCIGCPGAITSWGTTSPTSRR